MAITASLMALVSLNKLIANKPNTVVNTIAVTLSESKVSKNP